MNTMRRIATEPVADALFFSESEQEAFEERAAIMEYEAGLCREEAEQAALELMLKSRNELRTAV